MASPRTGGQGCSANCWPWNWNIAGRRETRPRRTTTPAGSRSMAGKSTPPFRKARRRRGAARAARRWPPARTRGPCASVCPHCRNPVDILDDVPLVVDPLPDLRRQFRTGAGRGPGLSHAGRDLSATAAGGPLRADRTARLRRFRGRSGRPRTRNSTAPWRSRFPAKGNSTGPRPRSSSARPARPRNWYTRTSRTFTRSGSKATWSILSVISWRACRWPTGSRASGSRTRRPRRFV